VSRERALVQALFVLLPTADALAPFLAALPEASQRGVAALTQRRYPRADDARHLRSLVRAGRDPRATRWLRGVVVAVATGAGLGGAVNGVLAGAFGLLGGLLEIAIPLGIVLGAFLGGFTAAMTGTEVARAELAALWPHVRPGCCLVQWTGDDGTALAALAAHARQAGFATASVRA
jgi:ABC-type phosphate transport system permease subunit